MSSAICDARSFTQPRSPQSWWRLLRTPSAVAIAKHTSPTGFSGVPPSGPAMPVVATATSTPRAFLAPAAIYRAVARERVGRHAEEASLDVVRVRLDAAAEVPGAAGHVGDAVSDEPAGAR